jgi:hypothetical protein
MTQRFGEGPTREFATRERAIACMEQVGATVYSDGPLNHLRFDYARYPEQNKPFAVLTCKGVGWWEWEGMR